MVSASSNRTSGTVNERYTYFVTTNVVATMVTFSFDGNPTLFTLHANGTNNFNAGTGSVSTDRRSWTWLNDLLGAGNRIITITAYDANGNSASTTLRITVAQPETIDVPANYRPRMSGGGGDAIIATLQYNYPVTEVGFRVLRDNGNGTESEVYNRSFPHVSGAGEYAFPGTITARGTYYVYGHVIIEGKRYESISLMVRLI